MLSIWNFIIVLVFNLFWFFTWGERRFTDVYSGNITMKSLTVMVWVYLGWGFINLIWAIVV